MSAVKNKMFDPINRIHGLPWEKLHAARLAYAEDLATKEILTHEDGDYLRRFLNCSLDLLADIEASLLLDQLQVN